MIQDISPSVYHNDYYDRKPSRDAVVLVVSQERILLRQEDGQVVYPTLEQLQNKEIKEADLRYVFAIDHTPYFLWLGEDFIPNEPWTFQALSFLRNVEPMEAVFVGSLGFQLARWYRDNVYCGRCATPFDHHVSERALVCPRCGNTVHPNLSPCVIVGIVNGDKLLLTRYKDRPYKLYALVAGYAEVGEGLEECVRREVYEEVGLKVKNLRYYKTQPWPFTSTLLVGYFCEVDGDPTIRLDEQELSEGVWLRAEEIPENPLKISLTNEMIDRFREGNWK